MVCARPTPSAFVTWVTTYLWNQSRIWSGLSGGCQYTGKHRIVFVSGDVGMRLLRAQSFGEYVTDVVPPDSLWMAEIRYRLIGEYPSSPSTRFAICTPSKVTAGIAAEPPTSPVWMMELSHSARLVVSPGDRKEWLRVHESTLRYAEPFHTFVVVVDKRLRVKNDGV